jgi:hypothetical protein
MLQNLRLKFTVRLPVTGKTITLLEPIAAQRQGILNNFIALLTSKEKLDDPKTNFELTYFIQESMFNYIRQNIENADVDFLDVNEVIYFVLPLLELLANGWYLEDEIKCVKCESKLPVRFVFNPDLLAMKDAIDPENTDKLYATLIQNIKELYFIEDDNFVPLYVVLPDKELEKREIVKIIKRTGDENLKVSVSFGHMLLKTYLQLLKSNLQNMQVSDIMLSMLHKLEITNENNTKLYLVYDAYNNIGDIQKTIATLPENIYKLIESHLKQYVSYYNETVTIGFKYDYICPYCNTENSNTFDAMQYFLKSVGLQAP